MHIYGFDFTSAPRRQKPILWAACQQQDHVLVVNHFTELTAFDQFERVLMDSGAWVGGFDFPFSLPRRFVAAMGWPTDWPALMAHLSAMTRTEFTQHIKQYISGQPPGDKLHRRHTDTVTGAISPMMIQGVPVGKMLFEGAPRLYHARLDIRPNQPTKSPKHALETYPALLARQWIGRQSYKSDDRRRQTADQRSARQRIITGLASAASQSAYGLRVELTPAQAEQTISDARGDTLDALLCAVLAAWAAGQPNYSIPPDCDPLEGWIINPAAPQNAP